MEFSVVFSVLKIKDNNLIYEAYAKCEELDFSDYELFAVGENSELKKLEMRESAFTDIDSEKALLGHFDGIMEIKDKLSISFVVEYNNQEFVPALDFKFKAMVDKRKPVAACSNYVVRYIGSENRIDITKASKKALKSARSVADKSVFNQSKQAFLYRKASYLKKNKKEIWLYCDRQGIFDNAYYQFLHDFENQDGVERYYIVDSLQNKNKYFSTEQIKNLVEFRSFRHKMLFLHCSMILTSFNTVAVFSPFGVSPLKCYNDITHYQVVYLQHGVLHAHLPVYYNKEKSNVDKVVISSEFEKENFSKIYGFNKEDLLFSGMPRYDTIDLNIQPQRKILFSPSWRMNLIGEFKNNTRELMEKELLESDFYKQVMAFLNSQKLADVLEKYDLTLDYKNHPIFRDYDKLFKLDNPRINITQENVEMQNYLAMITDYSSIVFDFVYLQRPVLYFVPDYEQFKSGLTHGYDRLDLPLEDGFGEIALSGDELADNLEKLAQNGFVSDEKYTNRMKNFFGERNTEHRECLYNMLKNER